MAFPTIPTTAAGTLLSSTAVGAAAARTFPNLSSLTKNSGDLLIAVAVAYQSSAAAGSVWSGWPTGWTEFADVGGGTSSMSIGAAYKWSTGAETGAFTITQAATITGDAVMFLMAIPGAHATTPPEHTAIATGTTAAASAGALTPSWGSDDNLFIALGASGETSITGTWTGVGATAPTNYGNLAGSNVADTSTVGQADAALAFRQLTAASDTIGAFSSVDVSNARNAAMGIVVRPKIIVPTSTATARVGFPAPASGTPSVTTNHSMSIRGRVQSGAGTFRMRLYQGATAITAEGETGALTTSLADYTIQISSTDAANITDYPSLEVEFRGYNAAGATNTFEVAEVYLTIPQGTVTAKTGSDTGADVETGTLTAAATDSDAATSTSTSTLVTTCSGSDTGAGTEIGTVGAQGSDTGGGAATSSTTTSSTDSDTAAGVGTSSQSVLLVGSDAATEAETASTSVPTGGSDSATGSDTSAETVFIIASDSGSGVESSLLSSAGTGSDTGSGSDTGTTTTPVVGSDAGSDTETSSLIATETGSEAASGADSSASSFSPVGSDAASDSETGSLVSALSGSDAATGTSNGTAGTVTTKTTTTFRVSLASANRPLDRTNHQITVRARITNGLTGTIRAQIYQGATAIGPELETSSLTGTLATYTLTIAAADAATLTDYSDLELRVRGFSAAGDAAIFEVADVALTIPAAPATQPTDSGTGTGTSALTAAGSGSDAGTGTATGTLTTPGTNTGSDSGTGTESASLMVVGTQVQAAKLRLAPLATPDTRTMHLIVVRARKGNAAHTATVRVQLFEGATARSGVLETPNLTTSFQDYALDIGDPNAAAITSYAALDVTVEGDSSTSDPAVIDVAEMALQVPSSSSALMLTGSDSGTGTSSASLAATAAGSDTGTGVSSAVSAVPVAGSDTATGADVGSLARATSTSETGAGVETSSETAASASSDTGAGVDSGTIGTPISASDTGTGASTATQIVAIPVSDSATGATIVSLTRQALEQGAGSDGASISLFLARSDSGIGVDHGTAAIFVPSVVVGDRRSATVAAPGERSALVAFVVRGAHVAQAGARKMASTAATTGAAIAQAGERDAGVVTTGSRTSGIVTAGLRDAVPTDERSR